MTTVPQTSMTIGWLAREAGVNIETVRYYHRRGLMPTPRKPPGRRAPLLFRLTHTFALHPAHTGIGIYAE
ncbi:MAG TPA: MerR family DNA-binding transcriptional regulator [Sulfuricaulis sp.]